MSKIFDALERAETDRIAARNDPPAGPGEESPPPRSGPTGWWKGLLVGMLVGAFGAAIIRSCLVDNRRPSSPTVPAVLESPTELASESPVVVSPQPSPPQPAGATVAHTDAAPTFTPASRAQVTTVPTSAPSLPSATTISVHATPIPSRSPSPLKTAVFRIQVGAFVARENAVRLATRLQRLHYPSTVQRGRTSSAPWVVIVGPYRSRGAAEAALVDLERAGFKGILVVTKPAAAPARAKGGRTRTRSEG